jgi:predicted DNA-binding transcriptional regulator AlpA
MTDPAPTVAPPPAAPAPLLVNATAAAAIVGVSRVVWWNLNRSARCPRPLALSRRPMWRADELRRWVEAGAPPRAKWEAMRGGRP